MDGRDIVNASASNNGSVWKELLNTALLEPDEAKLPERIKTAREAILQRSLELEREQAGEEQEAVALADALNSLKTLENILCHR